MACPVEYVKAVTKIIPKATFFTRTQHEDELSAIRFKFFDIVKVEQVVNKTRADFEQGCRDYLNRPEFSLDNALKSGILNFKTQKYVLSRGKIYLSVAHEMKDLPMDGSVTVGPVLDDPALWRDQFHFLFYTS